MSDLYTTPSQAQRDLRESTKTGNWFQDTFTDWVSDGISLNEDGSIDREGAAWWLQGLTPGAQSIAEQKKGIEDARTIHSAVQNSQLTDAQIKAASGGKGLTTGNVRGIIAEGQRNVADRITPSQQKSFDQQDAQIAATNKRLDNNLRIQLQSSKRYLQSSGRSSADIDNKELAIMQLEQQKLRDRRADERWNEQQERLDRKDRRMAISSIAAGLASLGAAFAI